MGPRRLPERRWQLAAAAAAAAAIVLAVAAALVAWQWLTSPPPPASAAAGAGASLARSAAQSTPRWPAAAPEPAASGAQPAALSRSWLRDDLGVAPDLKRVYDAHIDSADPRLRQVAVRALGACVPAFLPGPGETPSPEALIRALPANGRLEREAAYRTLYARCASLLGMGRDTLLALQRSVLAADASREAGVRAMSDLAAGNDDVANQRVGLALASGDPAAVAALSGVAQAWAQGSSAAPAVADRRAAARALDAALPWVACDLGLACGSDSLLALQACASQGQCEGDMPTRLAGAALADPAEAATIQAQRRRLMGLLKAGRALSLADLLP